MGRADTNTSRLPFVVVGLFAVVSWLLHVCSALAQNPMQVEWKEGRLSISADGVPLVQILREVSRQTEMKVEGLNDLEQRIFVHFTMLPLSEGLQKLLADVDYAMAIPGDARKAYLVIVRPASEQRPNVTTSANHVTNQPRKESVGWAERQYDPVDATADASIDSPNETPAHGEESIEDDGTKKLAAIQAAAEEHNLAVLRDEILGGDPNTQRAAFQAFSQVDPRGAVDVLVSATRSDDPALRIQAIQLLGAAPADESKAVLAALGGALRDADLTVRGTAIQTLAMQGGGAAMDLLQAAFRDSDPSIRILVIQSVAQAEEGRLLLEKAALDPDESVRISASIWLKQQADSAEK